MVDFNFVCGKRFFFLIMQQNYKNVHFYNISVWQLNLHFLFHYIKGTMMVSDDGESCT